MNIFFCASSGTKTKSDLGAWARTESDQELNLNYELDLVSCNNVTNKISFTQK